MLRGLAIGITRISRAACSIHCVSVALLLVSKRLRTRTSCAKLLSQLLGASTMLSCLQGQKTLISDSPLFCICFEGSQVSGRILCDAVQFAPKGAGRESGSATFRIITKVSDSPLFCICFDGSQVSGRILCDAVQFAPHPSLSSIFSHDPSHRNVHPHLMA